jgi:methionyl-tRNA formyltransferase
MTGRPDAGAIVDREPVTILPDDIALDVFRKVTCAAERTLERALPKLVDGSAVAVPQAEELATTFGGRKPEDGLIDWHDPAAAVHNLVRAVAPPYPGAFTSLRGRRMFVHRTVREGTAPHRATPLHLHGDGGHCFAVCGDGRSLRLVEATARDGSPFDLQALAHEIEERPLPLAHSL